MKTFAALPGLPGYGDLPLQFSSTGIGMHSEGFVVEFFPKGNPSWIGNFQRGLTRLDEVLQHPNGDAVIVIAGGDCYIVDIASKLLIETFGGQFVAAIKIPDKSMVVLESSTDFEAVDQKGKAWRSERISWDGIRNVALQQNVLTGEAWSYEDIWIPFSLNLTTGKHEGGAF